MGGGEEEGEDRDLHRQEGPEPGFRIYIGFRYIKTGFKGGGGRSERVQSRKLSDLFRQGSERKRFLSNISIIEIPKI